MRFKDITNQKFGRLTAIRYLGKSKWECKCDCGNIVDIFGEHLRRGHTKSCGCLLKEIASNKTIERNTTHNKSKTRLYRIYSNMKSRCYNKQHSAYQNYGGRGINICDEWLNSFVVFYDWAMDNGYQDDLSIDRIDNNKGYSPDNCHWATSKQQCNNTRSNVYFTYNGKKHTLAEWCSILGLKYFTVYRRIKYYNWSIEKALELV